MTERWSWGVRYVLVMLVALILGAALGGMELFRTTSLGNRGLTASHLVRFLGHGGALVVFWLLAHRATVVLREQGRRWSVLQHILLLLATLAVVGSAHGVLLLVLDPLMDATLHQVYNWLFIAGIVASAAWLVVALFNESSLTAFFRAAAASDQRSKPAEAKCAACGTALPSNARYCSQCGTPVQGQPAR